MLPGGADPTLTCQNQGPASCGTNGLCNGGGNCASYDISTECMTSCDATLIPTATHTFCDGAGQCAGLSVLEPCLLVDVHRRQRRLRALSRCAAVRSA